MNVTKQQAQEAFKVLEQYFKQQEDKPVTIYDWLNLVPASQELKVTFFEMIGDDLGNDKVALNSIDDCDIYECKTIHK